MLKKTGWSMALAASALSAASCNQAESTAPTSLHSQHAVGAMSPKAMEKAGLVTAVRAATARYHSTVVAEKDGYGADPFCVEVPGMGGMGHHWVNQSLVDPVFEPTKPEVMLYAPDKHGRLRLVAVEYLVINTGQAAPTFEGHTFDVGGSPLPVSHWTLHVWLYEPNPSGLHAPFNPNVDCP